jgi:hypothetical protein
MRATRRLGKPGTIGLGVALTQLPPMLCRIFSDLAVSKVDLVDGKAHVARVRDVSEHA